MTSRTSAEGPIVYPSCQHMPPTPCQWIVDTQGGRKIPFCSSWDWEGDRDLHDQIKQFPQMHSKCRLGCSHDLIWASIFLKQIRGVRCICYIKFREAQVFWIIILFCTFSLEHNFRMDSPTQQMLWTKWCFYQQRSYLKCLKGCGEF